MHGQFVWYDLMTSDPAGAQRFYTGLTGWKTQKFEHSTPDNPYTMWTNNGMPIGGVAHLTREQSSMGIPPHWLPSVHVRNVDESARQATSLGGKIVMPVMDIPETGRYAIIADPQGATLAIYQPPGQPDSTFDGTPKLGRHSWHELMTTDYKKAFDFYRQLFGWQKTTEIDMGGGNMYFMFGQNGKRYGGLFNRLPEMAQVPPFWLAYINVKDAKKSTEAATRAGAKIVNGPMQVPGGDWITVLQDPQGAAFAVHSVAAPTAAAKPKAKAKAKARPKLKAKSKARPKKKAKAKSKAKPRAKKAAKKKKAKRR